MKQYKEFKVGDLIHYCPSDYDDESIGIIAEISNRKREIIINWTWHIYDNSMCMGMDYLEFDDFDDLAADCKIITEQQQLEILLRAK
jgi:hypothetical protein